MIIKSRLRLRLSKRLINIFLTLTFLTCLLPVFPVQAQPPATPAMPQDIPVEPVKPVTKIDVKDGLLSVELLNAEFGSVIKEIAEKAKFRVEISGNVASKKISVSFNDIDTERGIRRLLTILKEKDFTISYNTEGLIDKMEIFGGVNIKPAMTPQKKPQTMQRPVPAGPSFPPPGTPPVPSTLPLLQPPH